MSADVLGGQVEATSSLDRRQVDVAARVPGQPVVAHGVAEHGPYDLVVALDRPGSVLGPPGVDQPLDVPGPDPLDAMLADRRQHVETEGELLSGGGGLPLVRVGGGPLLGELGHPEAAGPRVDPHAPADVGLDGGEEGPGVALGREGGRCDVPAAVVPVAGLVEPAPLSHAPERAHRRHWLIPLRRQAATRHDGSPLQLPVLRDGPDAAVAGTRRRPGGRRPSAHTACASKRTKRPTLTMGIRRSATSRRTWRRLVPSRSATWSMVRSADGGRCSPHSAQRRERWETERSAGEGRPLGRPSPAGACRRRSSRSMAVAAVVTFGAHRNPLSARRRWTRSAKVIRRTISSLATLTESASRVFGKSVVAHETAKATR